MYDALSLAGKVAIVTGGAGGIGEKTVELMIGRGARVAIADLNYAAAQELAARFGDAALAIQLDLANEDSIKAMVADVVKHFGRLDILHNNAAIAGEITARDGAILEMDSSVWDTIFDVNCRGTMIATREALPHLIAAKGSIVNTVSGLGLQGHIRQNAYSATKSAIMQMTRSVATTYGMKGVRCNAVAPGCILTPTLAKAFPLHWRKNVEAETPLGVLGAPEDIAEATAFLASSAAKYITGQTLTVDGGVSIHVPGFSVYTKELWN